ncbi:MAG: hypothetical protein IT538_14205 [Variibacter sp.]|nr:hypothetical protein [Variibacter sp.]
MALAMASVAAHAQSAQFSCVRSAGTVSCAGSMGSTRGMIPQIVTIPAPVTDEEVARSEARHARWASRCRPQFRTDRYGVKRAYYAAPGCDLGRSDD